MVTTKIKRPAGRPTIYNPKYHPRMVKRFGRNGRTQIECCAKFGIAEKTFYCWVKKRDEFKEAVALAQVYAEVYWIDVAKNHLVETRTKKGWKRANVNVLEMLMRAHRMSTRQRLLHLATDISGFAEAKTPAEKANCIVNAAGNGEITLREASQLLSVIARGLQIGEATELLQRLTVLEEVNELRHAA